MGIADLGQALEQHLPGPGQVRQRERVGHGAAMGPLGLGARFVGLGGGNDLQPRHPVDEIGQVGERRLGIAALRMERREFRKSAAAVAVHDGLEERDHAAAVAEAEHLLHPVGGDRGAAMGDRLVEKGKPVAHRAFGGAGDEAQRLLVDRHRLGARDAGHVGHEGGNVEAAQVEALAARQDGDRHLADLGGGEDELDVRRRLLERLQQRVEGRLRQHVDFVDDVDLVEGGKRLVAHLLDDLADVVDAGARGSIHFDDVDVAGFEYGLAVLAVGRHVNGGAGFGAGAGVVEGASDEAGGRRLADAADAGQHVGLGDAAGGEGVGEGAHHRFLADQRLEGLGPIFARQHAVAARRGRRFRRVVVSLGHRQALFSSSVRHAPSRAMLVIGQRKVGGWTSNPCQSR